MIFADAGHPENTVCLESILNLHVSVNGLRACDPEEDFTCTFGAFAYFAQHYRSGKFDYLCKCPINCKTKNYVLQLSSNKLSDVTITKIAEDYFLTGNCSNPTRYPDNCALTADMNETIDLLHDNIVDIEIYFKTLKVEDISERPSYSILALLCDIGGAMGLILGSTVLTIVEISEFLLFLIYDVIYLKMTQCAFQKKRKINPNI